jgi:hypothetical protein
MTERLSIVVLGLSITSSWGNGHATTYRALVRELAARGHDVLFLERDQPWYAGNRDMPHPRTGGRSSIRASRNCAIASPPTWPRRCRDRRLLRAGWHRRRRLGRERGQG